MLLFRIFLLSAALFLSCKPTLTQTVNPTALQLDSLLQTNDIRNFNGVVLISQRGQTLYKKAVGYADYEQQIPLTAEDEFVLLSNSKQITVEEGLLDVHQTIGNYLPNLNSTWADTVTVHQLLNHTSGLDGLDKPLLFAPGSDFKYADINYILLGQIIESVRKQTYGTVATDLFKQLQLNHTYAPDSHNQKDLIIGKQIIAGQPEKTIDSVIIATHKIPAAGIVSTAGDLTNWITLLHTGKILSDSIYQLLLQYNITASHVAFGPEKIGYSYGLRIADNQTPVYYGHTGTSPDQGFTSLTLWFPESQISVVVLENMACDNMETNYYFESLIRALMTESSWVK
jgi:D-alanyl-D-alanine carboxypeptidase